MTAAYRVQADDGRGPWRPGWSHTWIDGDVPADARISETLMDLIAIPVLRALPTSMHYGCACRSCDSLMQWFTPVERERLARLGFHPVRLNVDAVLAESDYQMFIARSRAFTDGASRLRWTA